MATVAFDASFLIPLLDPKITGFGEIDVRLLHLIDTLDKQRAIVVVPTPALSETLIGAGDAAPKYLETISRTYRFRMAPFGQRAAVEAAARHREALRLGDKKEGSESWAKLKFDRQIVAIAKVEGADTIYSNDGDIQRYAEADGLKVVTLDDLEGPSEAPDLFSSN
jgi:predicted nucleic acid-binding protein